MGDSRSDKTVPACILIVIGLFMNGGPIAGFITLGIVLAYFAFETNRWAAIEIKRLKDEFTEFTSFISEESNKINAQSKKIIKIELCLAMLCFAISGCIFFFRNI